MVRDKKVVNVIRLKKIRRDFSIGNF